MMETNGSIHYYNEPVMFDICTEPDPPELLNSKNLKTPDF